MKKQHTRLPGVLLAVLLVSPLITHGQTFCGSIIGREGGERYEQPIEDCTQPFGAPHENANITMQYGDTLLEDGGSYEFMNTTRTLRVAGGTGETYGSLYRHEGNDYILESDFTEETTHIFIQAGTYTLVAHEFGAPVLTHGGHTSTFDQLMDLLVPRVHAAHGPARVTTFVVTEPEERGVSNVLFLPGMQASRIYVDEDGEEEKLWEPGGNGDVERLAMDEHGESREALYTRDVIREIGGFALGGNIYKTFLQSLVDIDGPFDGPVVDTFAYDWRRSVFDVVRNGTFRERGRREHPTTTIALLSEISATGKTTIIAHSNGGLLAKAIMHELETIGRTELVDRVIMIGTPQIGTPKALAALLHGYDQEQLGGLLVDDEVVRGVMTNMPGAYGLLPSEAYINSLSTPLISFDDSEEVAQLQSEYGFTITNGDEYTRFLIGSEGRGDPGDDVRAPGIVNETLLTDALDAHRNTLDTWEPPEGVDVYEIVGTGLPTLASIEYRTFQVANCFTHHCVTEEVLKPYAQFTNYGDGTVVSKSAALNATKSLYADLSLIEDHEHSNITEAHTTRTLINHIIHGSSTDDIEFVTDAEPMFKGSYDVHSLHSPARIYITDGEGNVSGRTEAEGDWHETIPGSRYFEFGESAYAVVPSDIEYDVVVEGEATGVYTLMIDTIDPDGEQKNAHTLTAPITKNTTAGYSKTDESFSTIETDHDSDGRVDTVSTLDGAHVRGTRGHPEVRMVPSVPSAMPPKMHACAHVPPRAHKKIPFCPTQKEEKRSSKKNPQHPNAERGSKRGGHARPDFSNRHFPRWHRALPSSPVQQYEQI